MRTSLYTKLILTYIGFGIAAFVSIATLSSKLSYNYLLESRSSTLYDEATLIAKTYSSIYEGDDITLSETKNQLQAVATFLQADIWLVGHNGHILIDSSGDKAGIFITNFNPVATGNKSYTTGTYFGAFSENVLSVSAPIVGNYSTRGYIIIHLPMTKVLESNNKILNIVYISFLIIFLLSLLVLLIFYIIVSIPISKITEAAKQYAAGNLKYRVKVNSNDEIGYLADTLNFMSEELSKAEDYQKNFITNISHDFRSPLTSIKGYLEAILDGTISPQMQDKYIKRVISETERLTKLTNSILTLNSIDAKGYLNRSFFDVNRAIKDVATSFEGQCIDKNITLELNFSGEKQAVYADFGKIQQVLYNLIDNAIKFSHKNSSIVISVLPKYEKIFISIKDSGIGIPKKDLNKVFDRFYKSDISRGKDKKGTGLGLSIVRDIIFAHEENIDVISTEGVGTEFIFSLSSVKEN